MCATTGVRPSVAFFSLGVCVSLPHAPRSAPVYWLSPPVMIGTSTELPFTSSTTSAPPPRTTVMPGSRLTISACTFGGTA